MNDFIPTVAALVIATLPYPSGRLAAEEGERVEVARSIHTFYIFKHGALVYTTDDQGLMFRHFVVDIPLERIPRRTWTL